MPASGARPLFLYLNDGRCINVREGHPWHGIHRTRHLMRCDNTIFCIHCAGTSSGNTVQWMKDPCIPNTSIRRLEMPHKYNTVDRKLARGRCPYPGKWMSGLDRHVTWPPIDAHLYEDKNTCRTRCACAVCSSGRPPPGPPTDPAAPALTDGDVDDLNHFDWHELANLYDIHAPTSVIEVEAEYPEEGFPRDTPDDCTSSAVPSELDIVARIVEVLSTPPALALALCTAPTPVVRSKPPPFRLGRRGRGLIQQPNSAGCSTSSLEQPASSSQ